MIILRLCVFLTTLVLGRGNLVNPWAVPTEKTPAEVVEKWQNFDKKLDVLLKDIANQAVPMLIRMSNEVELSGECTTTMLKFLLSIRQMKPWAMNMLDVSGKLPAGILAGTLTDFGSYDRCQSIEVEDGFSDEILFRGMYCSLNLRVPVPKKPNSYRIDTRLPELDNFTATNYFVGEASHFAQMFYFVFIRIGLCLPSSCSIEDVQRLAGAVGKYIGLESHVHRCEVKETILITTDQWIVIGFVSFLVLLCLIGSAVQLFCGRPQSEEKPSLLHRLAMAFSIPRNVYRLLDTDHISPDAIPVLDSIRFFSIVWVILGHSYLFINWQLMRDFRKGQTYIKDFAFQAVMSGFVSVDSFFFISGLLVSYLAVKHVLRDGEKTFNIPIFIIRRVWRLLPSTLLLLGLTLLIPFAGNGPIWHETTDIIVSNCRKNWWTNVLFFNNYLHATEQCQSTTWFTACEMQMFLVGLVFLAIVIRKPRAGFILLAIMIIFSIVSTAVITYYYELPPTLLFISPDPRGILDLWHYTHFKPHVHIGSYAIGLGLGHVFAHKKFPKFSQVHKSVCWFLAIVLALLVVYGPYEWNHTRPPTVVESVLYNGFHRPVWIAAVAWVTYACTVGFGGIINSILSWRGFIPLSRLTYVAYLWHATVIWVYIGNLHGSIDTSHFVMVWMFLGNLFVSFALAFLFHIICEAPFAQLEAIIIGRRREVASKKDSSPTNDHEIPTINGKSYGPNGVVVYKM